MRLTIYCLLLRSLCSSLAGCESPPKGPGHVGGIGGESGTGRVPALIKAYCAKATEVCRLIRPSDSPMLQPVNRAEPDLSTACESDGYVGDWR